MSHASRTLYALSPVLVVLAAFVLRVHALGAKSLWYDELRQIEVAARPLADFPSELVKHSARPLDYWLTHFLLRAGRQEFWLRFPAALWSTLGVALVFPLARRWFDRRTALAAAALMAAAPLGVQYGQELRPYALYLLFALISAWALGTLTAPAKEARGREWVLFGLACVGGALTHYFYIFLLAAQTIFVAGLFAARRIRRAQLAAFGAGALAGAGALFVAANAFTLATFAQNFLSALITAPLTGLRTDAGAALTTGDVLNTSFFVDGLLPAYGAGPGAALVVFNGLALFGLAALLLRHRRVFALFGLWLCLAPGLVILYLQYRQQFFANRYALFALPVYLLCIAHGLAALARRSPFRRGAFAAGLLILIGLSLNRVIEDYARPKDEWRRVGAFLAANVRPGDVVAAPDVQFFVRFYAPALAGSLVDANDVGPHEQALADAERFWFVWSDYTLIPIEETRQWVQRLPGVTLALDPRIRVIFVHPGLTPEQMRAEAQAFFVPPPSAP
jgi:uncharacterized membrane protein